MNLFIILFTAFNKNDLHNRLQWCDPLDIHTEMELIKKINTTYYSRDPLDMDLGEPSSNN